MQRRLLGPIGFAYDEWSGVFFPVGLRKERRLEYLASQFQCVEIDATFYGLPTPETLRSWSGQVPPDFTFIFKAPAEVTHRRESREAAIRTYLEFLDRISETGPGRTLVLVQFAPSFPSAEWPVVEELLGSAPQWRDQTVIEFRHPSWSGHSLLESLPCVALADLAAFGEAAKIPKPTEFVPWPPVGGQRRFYLRLNGRHGQYEHDNRELHNSKSRIEWLLKGAAPQVARADELIVVAGNSYAGHAPATLGHARSLLGMAEPTPMQGQLFEGF